MCRSKFLWRLLILLQALLVLACSTPRPSGPDQSRPVSSPSSDEARLAVLMDRARSSPSPASERAILEAARLLLSLKRDDDASLLLQRVSVTGLDAALAAEIYLLRSGIMLSANQPYSALELLNSEIFNNLTAFSETLQQETRSLRAQAYADTGRSLAAAQERIYLNALLPEQEKQNNHEQIWKALTSLNPERLNSLAGTALGFEFQGWYELGLIGKAYQYNLDRQLVELEHWQNTWQRHPAARHLPQALQLVRAMAEARPDTIALLLPLNTLPGKIVRDGFMSAYYKVQEIGGKVPTILFYDTSRVLDIVQLHQQAVADGAELVIGPLQKSHVMALSRISLDVPTLALNSVDEAAENPRLYQFALSPEDEAEQIARKAWQDGHRYAAILSPRDAAGEDYYLRKRESFRRTWLALGGRITNQEIYQDDYTQTIEALLNLDDSARRKEALSDVIRKSLQFTQRRRQDIDFIFLIAQPGPGRQIKPSLAYLYAGDIPVYATQDIYSGISRPLEDQDLNGILFSDSPWLLSREDELKIAAESLFPQKTGSYLRLQAFGIDAFRLYPRLKQLESVPDDQLFGATGLLKMKAQRHIYRELSWATMLEGEARPLQPPADQ